VALNPIIEAIRTHVMRAERIHADDTTVPVLAKLKTVLGRIWTYVRDDRPFGGQDPPAALFYYSCNRAGEHPQSHLAGYVGLIQADAFDGYNHASSTTVASVSPTTPPNEPCAAWRSEERIGPSPVQMPAAIVPPPSIPLSKPAR
jgi:hypothetical protein